MARLVLASQSPARLTVLRNAGVTPIVQVSYVDEDSLAREHPHATRFNAEIGRIIVKAELVLPATTNTCNRRNDVRVGD